MNKDDLDPTIPIFRNQLTINKNGSVGYSFYHDYDFVATADTCVLSYKNKDLEKLDNSVNHFLAKILTNLFSNNIYNYIYKLNQNHISRESILLPCLEVKLDDQYIYIYIYRRWQILYACYWLYKRFNGAS
ncbi:restriction endonuclease subunit S [Mycoplasma iguanae]|uniref:restriction endonuclease subunit S n=1 Tax=Mycoplasma iguanae TaxID=292461 RepID=UPI00358FA691